MLKSVRLSVISVLGISHPLAQLLQTLENPETVSRVRDAVAVRYTPP